MLVITVMLVTRIMIVAVNGALTIMLITTFSAPAARTLSVCPAPAIMGLSYFLGRFPFLLS